MSDKRYEIKGKSVFFHDVPIVLYKNFWIAYKRLTYTQARRKLKSHYWSGKEQDEIIHFLKNENHIRP